MKGVRSPEGAKKSVESFVGDELARGKIYYEECDTGDLESVRNFAKKVQEKFPAIHLLINNGELKVLDKPKLKLSFLAGVMATPYKETKDGFESQMAINYIGHFLLTHLLLPQLVKGSKNNDGKNSRIVNVSSCVHRVCDMNYEDFHFKSVRREVY